MKTSTVYLLATVLSIKVTAECIEGTRQGISPGYIVKHMCGFYREGEPALKHISSKSECAALAKNAGVYISTYHVKKRQCKIARPGGRDIPYPGATLLQKGEEEDPSAPETCEGQRDEFKDQLDKCRADLDAASKRPSCGVNKWGMGFYKRVNNKMTPTARKHAMPTLVTNDQRVDFIDPL